MARQRRDVLKTVGAAAAVAIGAETVRGRHDTSGEYERQQPAHVTIDYPSSEMDTYRPALDLSDVDRSRLQGLWGWRATSPEYDRDWFVYWARYSHQSGVSEYDSHLGDHEPVYVAVKGGDVDTVLFSAYHWLRGGASGEAIPLTDDTHPSLYVNSPYHHYTLGQAGDGVLEEVNDLADGATGLDAWLANGLAEDLLPGAVHDPVTMTVQEDWWRNDLGGRIQVLQLELFRRLGINREGGLLP